ncbi:MAG: class I SAM-dependent methyltransferase [Micrococcales bacterium]|nr:class I SAM-dependent methyltransferase [Micrococcales bacterium]
MKIILGKVRPLTSPGRDPSTGLDHCSRRIYSAAYEEETWGSAESGSGTGSELRATEMVRRQLPDLFRRHGVTSLLDAPCGDWNWMQHIDLSGIDYVGADIVPGVVTVATERFARPGVSFIVADLTKDPLPRADAVMCRDCWVHVSYADIAAMLANYRSTGATWVLINTYPEIRQNRNQFTGTRWRRLNFTLPPFNFPEPVEMIIDGGEVDPSRLALWRLGDLPELCF